MTRGNRTFAHALAAAALLATAACQDLPDPVGARPDDPARVVEEEGGELPAEKIERPLEEEFAAIAAEVPAFAGYTYEGGVRLVQVTDPAQADRALQAVGTHAKLPEDGAREGAKITGESRAVEAKFTFLELRDWRNRMFDPVLDEKGVEFLDLDEAANRVTVGISSPEAAERVGAMLEKLAVPAEAVLFEETKPAVDEFPTMRDRFRPLRGGYQIQFDRGGSRFNCTYGFNAAHALGAVGVINSHCTTSFWANDGISIFQNTVAGANFIGREVRDRSPWRCGFFWLYRCRYSDAALVGLQERGDLGGIARTQFWAFGRGGVGSIAIDAGNPRLQIVAERPYPYVGLMMDKMGRTTGWTWGWVTRTGVDVNKGGGLRLLDQAYASYGSDGGDSGSPTFVWHGERVTLAGIHWGSTGDGRNAIFSPVRNIEADLGALTTF